MEVKNMKKVLSLLGLIAILGSTIPCYAHCDNPHRGQMIQAGPHYSKHMKHPHAYRNWGPPPPHYNAYNRSSVFVGGVLARRSCWSYSDCYYNGLRWYDNGFYPSYPTHPPVYINGMYVNVGIPIRF